MEYCCEEHVIKKSCGLTSFNENNTELVGGFSVRLFGNFLWLLVVLLLHDCTVRNAFRVILFRDVCCSSLRSSQSRHLWTLGQHQPLSCSLWYHCGHELENSTLWTLGIWNFASFFFYLDLILIMEFPAFFRDVSPLLKKNFKGLWQKANIV